MKGGGRRLLEALGDTTPAFTAEPGTAGARGPGRLLAALADATPRRADDEFRRRPARSPSPGLVLAALLTGLVSVAADLGATGTAAVRIAANLGGFEQQAWVSTPFLAAALVTVVGAPWADGRFGTRRCLLLALGVFALGAAVSAVVPSVLLLAVTRTVQGAGAGAVFALAFPMVMQVIEPRLRGRYLGLVASAAVLMTAVGPVLGGFAAELGWRALFLGEGGLAVLGLVAGVVVFPEDADRAPSGRAVGLGTISLALVPLVVVAGAGPRWGWGSAASVLCFTLSALGLAAFAVVVWSAGEDAVLPVSLLRARPTALPLAGGFLVGALSPVVFVLFPLHLQVVGELPPLASGLLAGFAALVMTAASLVTARLSERLGRIRATAVAGVLLAAAGIAWAAWAGATIGSGVLIGAGLGIAGRVVNAALWTDLERLQWASASRAMVFARHGGTFAGTTAYLTVVFAEPGSLALTTSKAFFVALGIAAVAAVVVAFLAGARPAGGSPGGASDPEDVALTHSPGLRPYWPRTGF